MYVLDTNVISEFRKAPSGCADLGVVAWARRTPPSDMFLSVLTIFEIERGILKVGRRDSAQAAVLRNWFDHQVIVEFRDRLLAVDAQVAIRAAALHLPDPRPERDAFIAATALVHTMIVVTRNHADFEPTGVRLFNPWGLGPTKKPRA